MTKHTLKLSTIVALNNFRLPISYCPIIECYGKSKSFTVDKGVKVGNLIEVVFGMKNLAVASDRCQMLVNQID
jgi:hypothetical protein